jgi:hypothetical protein
VAKGLVLQEVRDQKFAVTRVVDDQIFTYIQLAKSQNRLAVSIGKSLDLKKLEPVKYTDEGEYYIVHRVLSLSERLYLKLGDDTSEIQRCRGGQMPHMPRQIDTGVSGRLDSRCFGCSKSISAHTKRTPDRS